MGVDEGGDRTIQRCRTTDYQGLFPEDGPQLKFRKFPKAIKGEIRHGVILSKRQEMPREKIGPGY
jgi:hypothetical protein